MPIKVMIMELKEDYALAMQEGGGVIRIRKNENMHVGDQVYVLPEDLYEKQKEGKILAFTKNPHRVKKALMHLTATAAMVAVAVILLFPQVPMKAHAVVSFDGERSMQMQIDKNNKIIAATSCDSSLPQEELKQLEGKNLMDLGDELQKALGIGPVLVAYASENKEADEAAEAALRAMFQEQGLLYLSGSDMDISEADAAAQSLGRYLLSLKLNEEELDRLEDAYEAYFDQVFPEQPDDDRLEEKYEAMGLQALMDMLQQDPSLINQEAFRDALGDCLEDTVEASLPPELDDDVYDDVDDDLDDVHDDRDDADDDQDDRDGEPDDDDLYEDDDDPFDDE